MKMGQRRNERHGSINSVFEWYSCISVPIRPDGCSDDISIVLPDPLKDAVTSINSSVREATVQCIHTAVEKGDQKWASVKRPLETLVRFTSEYRHVVGAAQQHEMSVHS